MIKIKFLLFSLAFTCSTIIQAQIDDHIIWATLKLQKQLNPKTSVAFTPIFRFNDDISNYQNMSIDVSAKRKVAKDWSVQLLARTWFVPDDQDRQFLWLDVIYGKKFKHIQIGSFVRYHFAFDIKDRTDADFIRWKTTFTLLSFGKFKPFVAIEPWWRLEGVNDFQRMRYEPGIKYDASKELSFSAVLRRETSVNLEPTTKVNQYVLTAAYKLPARARD